jgi:large subunit ribosomal protein L27Ae
MAGGQHHHRTLLDKFHPGYFGKLGMRYYHKTQQKFFCPTVNVDKIWTLVSAQTLANAKTRTDGKVPVIDCVAAGFHKVLGNGLIPKVPVIVKAKIFSTLAEKKIRAAGGVCVLIA